MLGPMDDTSPTLEELKSELRIICDLESAGAVLSWDQQTYMPAGGAVARGRQLALLGRLAHERRASQRMGELLAELGPRMEEESATGALLRRASRDRAWATRIPAALVEEVESHSAAAYMAWTEARPANDFKRMRPFLEKTLTLSRRVSDCFEDRDHVADPLIDREDPGMDTASVRALFAELRGRLVPLVERLLEQRAPETSFLRGSFDEARQLAFGKEVIERLGYDFTRGRQDKTHHPFMTRFAAGDVRITTRIREDEFGEALFSTIHEAGHALYELGIDPAFDGSPLGQGTSAGVHESQSRLWENIVGRGEPFWRFFLPRLREVFPEALAEVEVAEFVAAINKVERSLIRTDADEVTYNLHVMIRFDLETQMLEGSLPVADLPDAWNARVESDLGVRPPDDRDGCLQDVHWYCTTIGGTFQGYTLGNLMSAQIYEAALRARADIPVAIAEGNFEPLRSWLGERVYRSGASHLPANLIERATGSPLSVDPFMKHLEAKFLPLYGLAVDRPIG